MTFNPPLCFLSSGGLEEWNQKLAESPEMKTEFRRINARHSAIRREFVRAGDLEKAMKKWGPLAVEKVLATGIAGIVTVTT